MSSYDHKKIEKKWREEWTTARAYATDTDTSKEKYYVLDMFPYPSGAGLHVGHPKGYIASDVIARKKRMEGRRVLHPMGWDAFGLPAENYAIKTGTPPQKTTDESIATFKKQISNLALSYDWDREIGSHRPDYYRWTQWLFTKFFEKGLVYKKKALVNWDPVDQTVLANEQVLPDGTAERSGAVVEKKELEQWFYKITDYADELIDKLDTLDWPESTKTNQRNWIGRSEGAEIDFGLDLGKKHKYLYLHGFTSGADRPRNRYYRAGLEALGHEVYIPDLPNTNEPVEEEQVATALATVELDENTVLVGHSLGAVVAMKALLKAKKKIARLVLVAPAIDPSFPGAERRIFHDTFRWDDIDYEQLQKLAGHITLLSDLQEPQVRIDYIRFLAPKLGAELVETMAVKEHFTGDTEPDVLMWMRPTIRVFTTRPDTLFGATYLVLAPEHPWVLRALEHGNVLKNNAEVQAYVEQARKKSDIDRLATDKEKTGVKLEGVDALNPATGEKIPLYIADYVLAHYGTGAIMAVPAHDERDHAFAKKFDLPIRRVVEPAYTGKEEGAPLAGQDFEKRNAVCAIVRNPKNDTYLCISWKQMHMNGLVTGGIDDGEDPVEAARREVREETGYKNLKLVWDPRIANHTKFYHRLKKVNRWARFTNVFFELENEEREPIDQEEADRHEVKWLKREELKDFFSVFEGRFIVDLLDHPDYVYTGEGVIFSSGEYDWMDSEEARRKITERYGRVKKTYKLRDWLISRQRYWGAPIPIVYDPEGKAHAIPEEHLPWMLPTDVEYLPKGTSPLGSSKELLERTERIFGKGWRPEIDTMDTFACSSWYFFRFADPHNEKEFASAESLTDWLPVDLYIGGAEHTVLHLLYARFFTKALRDMGHVTFDEPFLKLRHQGLIVAEDGRKMSKRYGNVINPDDIVETYGADTLRVYEMFMGPFQDSIAWNTQSMIGARRFLERVWRTAVYVVGDGAGDAQKRRAIDQVLHASIKKVGDDIEGFKFNTAVSQLMILLNAIDKEKQIERGQWNAFLRLLGPFAPHVAEELWAQAGNDGLLQQAGWPVYDESLLHVDTVTYAIQVDGKMRGSVAIASDADDAAIESAAAQEVADRLAGADVARVVIVPKRLVNFVLKK